MGLKPEEFLDMKDMEIERLEAEVAHLRAFFSADETVGPWCNLCCRVHALDVPHQPRKETNQ